MKAKVIETGEIVNVTPYPTWYKENGQGPDRREWDEDELEFIYSANKAEAKEELYNKPAWSEEDERLCQCLIKDQEKSLDNVRNDKYGHSEIISDLKEMYWERIDWLKSLKDRITWKPRI